MFLPRIKTWLLVRRVRRSIKKHPMEWMPTSAAGWEHPTSGIEIRTLPRNCCFGLFRCCIPLDEVYLTIRGKKNDANCRVPIPMISQYLLRRAVWDLAASQGLISSKSLYV